MSRGEWKVTALCVSVVAGAIAVGVLCGLEQDKRAKECEARGGVYLYRESACITGGWR